MARFAALALLVLGCGSVDRVRGDVLHSATPDTGTSPSAVVVATTGLSANLALALGRTARAMACDGSIATDAESRIGGELLFLSRVSGPLLSQYRCAAQATTCKAYRGCLLGPAGEECVVGRGFLAPDFSDVDEPVTSPDRCDGNTLVHCVNDAPDGPAHLYRQSCAAIPSAPQCITREDDAFCGGGPTCEEGVHCKGTLLTLCFNGGGAQVDCGLFGQGCSVDATTGPGCGLQCKADSCAGDVAISCRPEAHENADVISVPVPGRRESGLAGLDDVEFVRQSHFDCSMLGSDFGCVLTAEGRADCRADAPTCELGPRAFCDGERLVTCLHGEYVAVDCGAVDGFACGERSETFGCLQKTIE